MSVQGTAISITLDVSTLFIVAACVTALLGLFLLFAWTQDRIRALAWWGSAYLIGGFSIALWGIGGQILAFVPSSVPSALLFLACGMIWNAARLFHGRKVRWIAMPAGSLIWLIACELPSFEAMSGNRIILASLIISAYMFLTAAELWRERRQSLIRHWPALFVPMLHGAVFLFPIRLASALPDERVTLASGWIAVFVLQMLLYAVGTAFIVLVITKERTLRKHKTAALTDPMTGVFNRRGLIEAVRELTTTGVRGNQPIAVLIFDLDRFKSVNDRFGHAVGDETLKLFATVAAGSMRLNDFIARVGGEEFAAVIRGTVDDGIVVAERIRVAFENAARSVAGHYLGATVSVGVAGNNAATNIDALLARADMALYVAKAGGRNRVEADLSGSGDAASASEAAEGATSSKTLVWTSYRRPLSEVSDHQAA
jgi:diguanylate cyclase (GGDEF)-like protein